MLNKKTVFIVGAGASAEVGLPVGSQLVSQIAEGVNLTFDWGSSVISGHKKLGATLLRLVQSLPEPDKEFQAYMQACHRLRRGLSQAPSSIDTYLDTHSSDTRMVQVGKLAIANYILEAEQRSNLYFAPETTGENLRYTIFQNTWYPRLQDLMFSGIRKESLASAFSNASFIVFNYDRCIEHFLFYAVRGYFHIDDNEAARSLSLVKFIHPYGSIAPLSWQAKNASLDFGFDAPPLGIQAAAARLRLFTEGLSDPGLIAAIGETLDEADRIVFLGFGFHDQNLRLLTTKRKSQQAEILGTASGISTHDIRTVQARVAATFGQSGAVNMDHRWKCADLFNDLHYTIRS